MASLSDYVQEIVKLGQSIPSDQFLWFRGVACDGHKLAPKLLRDGKTTKEIYERENRLITRFRQRSVAYWSNGYGQSAWDQLFAMQHYGVPTRLLDWSENAFVAAYFALSEDPKHPHACCPSAWCMNPTAWNRAMPTLSGYGDVRVLTTADDELAAYEPNTVRKRLRSPVAIFGTHNSERIVAQRGTFVVWGTDIDPMDDVAKASSGTLLWKFNFRSPRDTLFKQLESLGFTETTVYPELSYLADELTRTEPWR